jgi:hypothetical protein
MLIINNLIHEIMLIDFWRERMRTNSAQMTIVHIKGRIYKCSVEMEKRQFSSGEPVNRHRQGGRCSFSMMVK